MSNKKFNFTKSTIDKLSSPIKSTVSYMDTKEKGLSLYITKNRVITFFVRKRVQGKDQRIIIGNFPDISVENARRAALKIKSDIAHGVNPNKKKEALRKELLFNELFELYLSKHAKLHKKSWIEDEEQYKRYLIDWDDKKISTLTKDYVSEFYVKIRENHGLYAANRLLSLLKIVFNKAIEWGWEGKNPTIGIKKFKEKSRDRFLQADELPRFYKALFEEENTNIRDYIFMSLMTGARKSNVLSMRWDEVNLHDQVKQWRIPETKNGEPLTIPLNEDAVELLKAKQEQAESDWVFPSDTSKSGHLEEPKKGWKRILERANIKDLRLHDLRRTYGSWQAMTGSSTAIIGKSLGHKNKNTTAIYERLNLDPVRQSMNKATEAMTKDSRDVINKIVGKC